MKKRQRDNGRVFSRIRKRKRNIEKKKEEEEAKRTVERKRKKEREKGRERGKGKETRKRTETDEQRSIVRLSRDWRNNLTRDDVAAARALDRCYDAEPRIIS